MVARFVQHHPARAALLPSLLERLGPAVVVTDPDPCSELRSPWRTYRACLQAALASGESHALIAQDDCVPCPLGFQEAVCGAAAARPDSVLALFVPGAHRTGAARVIQAAGRGVAFASLEGHSWLPVVALVWPTAVIPRVLAWVDAQRWPVKFRADDEIVGRALRALRVSALATAPSLVEHPDEQPSLIGLRHAAGRDRGRVAACLIPHDCDPRNIDWNTGAR